nr:hypothetical protein [Avibacterium paragallinarum]
MNIHPVKYRVNGITIAANVYTPANFDPNKNTQPSPLPTQMAA